MPRQSLTQEAFQAKVRTHHLPAMEAAIRSLKRALSDEDVCDCDEGNAAGVTAAECGCEHREAAKVLEAGGCYIRRGLERGFTL